MEQVKWLSLAVLLLFLAGCGKTGSRSDAYGQFYATEITLSAQHGGVIRELAVQEGQKVKEGQKVGQIDTTALNVRLREIRARIEAARKRAESLNLEMKILSTEIQLARRDLNRLLALKKDNAATEKQIEDVRGKIEILRRRRQAASLKREAAEWEVEALIAQKQSLQVKINEASVIAPITGRVLTLYRERGELVQPGQPILKVADLDTMILKAYISGVQLDNVHIGEQVQVLIDKGRKTFHRLQGSVSWIASEAEFTPQMIQTKQERVTQVYAIEVRVENDGRLKIGMPGEIRF